MIYKVYRQRINFEKKDIFFFIKKEVSLHNNEILLNKLILEQILKSKTNLNVRYEFFIEKREI